MSETTAKKAIVDVLRESFHGANDHGAFLDPGLNGFLDLLKRLSAKEASMPIAGASVATHALHVSFSLGVFSEWIQGVREVEYDWNKSWEQGVVNDEEWDELRSRIEQQHIDLERVIKGCTEHGAETLWGAAGALAHTAYHLGIVQVKVDELQKK